MQALKLFLACIFYKKGIIDMKMISLNNTLLISNYAYLTLGAIIYNKENHGSYIGIKINDKLNIYIRAFGVTDTATGDITDITEATYRNLVMQILDKNKDIVELNGVIFVSNDNSETCESMILRNTSTTIGDYTYFMSYDSRLEITKVNNKE